MDSDLVRKVIEVAQIPWKEIHEHYAERYTSTPPYGVFANPASRIKFYKKFEVKIWAFAAECANDQLEKGATALTWFGQLNGAKTITGFSDFADLAARVTLEEASYAIYDDWESNHDDENSEYAQYRDIWEPAAERGDVHDILGYDESIIRKINKRLL
jgi:hypothetical protein